MSLEKHISGYRIQEGSGDTVIRGDKNPDNPEFRTVASGKTAEEALLRFVELINNEDVEIYGNFYRIVKPNGEVVDWD